MIGVILMVAITVILAAVIGTFVLGIGQNQNTTPSTTFDYNFDDANNRLDITVSGGDSLTTDNSASIVVSIAEHDFQQDSGGDGTFGEWLEDQGSSINAGTSYTVFEDDSSTGTNQWASTQASGNSGTVDINGDTVRIIWSSPGGDKTQTISNFDVPS